VPTGIVVAGSVILSFPVPGANCALTATITSNKATITFIIAFEQMCPPPTCKKRMNIQIGERKIEERKRFAECERRYDPLKIFGFWFAPAVCARHTCSLFVFLFPPFLLSFLFLWLGLFGVVWGCLVWFGYWVATSTIARRWV
jgi:hypothetical protein